MAIEPGQPVPSGCTHVGNFPFSMLKGPTNLQLDTLEPIEHVDRPPSIYFPLRGSLPLAEYKQEYIDLFEKPEHGLTVCNQDNFAKINESLRCYLGSATHWCIPIKYSVYACLHGSSGVSIFFTRYKGLPIWNPWDIGYDLGYEVKISGGRICPHGYDFPSGAVYRSSPTNNLLTFREPLHNYPSEYVYIAPFMMKTCNFSTNFQGDNPARLDFDFELGSVILEAVNPSPIIYSLTNTQYLKALLYDYKPFLDEMTPCSL